MIAATTRPSPDQGLSFLAVGFHLANPDYASVCQLSLARVIDGALSATDELLVLPPTGAESLEARFTRQHGITQQMLRADGVAWRVALDHLLVLQRGQPLVTHNAGVGHLAYRAANDAVGVTPPEATWYDTLPLARAHLELPDYQLATVADALEVPEGPLATMIAGVVLALAGRDAAGTLDELWAEHPSA
ncbi:MAG: hypothetical protein ACTHZ5_03905 [Micrococcaceae bacterium]